MRPALAPLAGLPAIIGSGVAGLAAALALAPAPCVLVTAGALGEISSSALAQGGLAAALGPDDDVALHLADTLAAGDGLCDGEAAASIIAAAPGAVRRLAALGARFDRAPDGSLALGLEAAHSRRRIAHARGDATGAEVVRALVAAVRAAGHVTVLEGTRARRILTRDGAVTGVVLERDGRLATLPAGAVALATGGAGGLYPNATCPLASAGGGLAMAARAGARLADMEFMQFHPTALALAPERAAAHAAPAPLVSEAVRGEGAVLVNDLGERFMAGVPGQELAPRDVVARAIWRQIAAGRRVFLDARERPGAGFARRFPGIAAICARHGLDPARDLLPVAPAAHYHMGGVAVDADGRASVAGLWACGEVACTGLHGANRLASNSLVDALVCGARAGAAIRDAGAQPRGPRLALAEETPAPPAADAPALARVRQIMSRDVGLERDAAGLSRAVTALAPLAAWSPQRDASPAAPPPAPEQEAALAGLLIAHAALARAESRGAHFRRDCPGRAPASRRQFLDPATALAPYAAPPRAAAHPA